MKTARVLEAVRFLGGGTLSEIETALTKDGARPALKSQLKALVSAGVIERWTADNQTRYSLAVRK